MLCALAVWTMRRAISPRFAMRILRSGGGNDDCGNDGGGDDGDGTETSLVVATAAAGAKANADDWKRRCRDDNDADADERKELLDRNRRRHHRSRIWTEEAASGFIMGLLGNRV